MIKKILFFQRRCTAIYQQIEKAYLQIQLQIAQIQKELAGAPAGNLVCCHHGRYCKWYRDDRHTRVYIPKSDRKLAEQLAAKKYLSSLLKDLLHEKKALEAYLKHHVPPAADQAVLKSPGYRELLSSRFKPISSDLAGWASAGCQTNPLHPEHLIHKSISGHLVRSKSEAMIDHLLFTRQIPFRYECELCLDGKVLYPDFTIRHPQTGETFYWEHFGMMDDPSYRKQAVSKIRFYSDHGIFPALNLITTYETHENPLDMETIQKTIRYYFEAE